MVNSVGFLKVIINVKMINPFELLKIKINIDQNGFFKPAKTMYLTLIDNHINNKKCLNLHFLSVPNINKITLHQIVTKLNKKLSLAASPE